jgi:aminopeptidase
MLSAQNTVQEKRFIKEDGKQDQSIAERKRVGNSSIFLYSKIMFTPPSAVLQKYAALFIRFALNEGRGAKKGEVIQLSVPDSAKPLLPYLIEETLKIGAHPKIHFIPTLMDKVFFEHASQQQRTFFAEAFKKAEVELIDHSVSIIADADPKELSTIDPKHLFEAMDARKKTRDWLNQKELEGKFSWTLGLYGTEAMAKEANMTLEEYWEQIIHACFLDAEDPIEEWKKIQDEQERIKTVLNALEVEWLHIEGASIDLRVQIGKGRKWLGGTGRNIPSFELFISPDARGTEGKIFFNQPLYRYGNILRGVSLTFKDGLVVDAHADEGEDVLRAMIERKNANRIGEYSLTDRRFSRITKFMANTLFDENIGGEFGNTHLALGRAYKESYTGDQSKLSEKDWEDLGYNESPEHTDIISTEDRTVTATLADGSRKVIFKNGEFQL